MNRDFWEARLGVCVKLKLTPIRLQPLCSWFLWNSSHIGKWMLFTVSIWKRIGIMPQGSHNNVNWSSWPQFILSNFVEFMHSILCTEAWFFYSPFQRVFVTFIVQSSLLCGSFYIQGYYAWILLYPHVYQKLFLLHAPWLWDIFAFNLIFCKSQIS